jgi:hypothetical protein
MDPPVLSEPFEPEWEEADIHKDLRHFAKMKWLGRVENPRDVIPNSFIHP